MLDSSFYREFHQQRGERFRWLKAIPVPVGTPGRMSDGVILVEQTIVPEAKFLVSNTTQEIESTPFGPIPVGTMEVSAFPDWARFNHLDRLILDAPGRLLSQVVEIERGGDEDFLPMPYVTSITDVWISGNAVPATNYVATETGIKWVEDILDEGDEYSVEYLYAQRYLVLPQAMRTSPTDINQLPMPLYYWLQLEQNTEGE